MTDEEIRAQVDEAWAQRARRTELDTDLHPSHFERSRRAVRQREATEPVEMAA